MGGTRLVTPVDVSLWTTSTALIACALSSASLASTTAGSAPCLQSVSTRSTTIPRRLATSAHSRFPAAGAGRGIDDDGAGRVEDLAGAVENLACHGGKLGAAMIDRRLRQRAQHAVGNVRRSGDLKEVAAWLCH